MDSWMRAAPIAVTAIGRHLLSHSSSVTAAGTAAVRGGLTLEEAQGPPSIELVHSRSAYRQAFPLSVKSCGAEFSSSSQVPRKPTPKVPSLVTVLL